MNFEPIEDGIRGIATILRDYAGEGCSVVELDALVANGFSKYSLHCVENGERGKGFPILQSDQNDIRAVLNRIYVTMEKEERGYEIAISISTTSDGKVDFSMNAREPSD